MNYQRNGSGRLHALVAMVLTGGILSLAGMQCPAMTQEKPKPEAKDEKKTEVKAAPKDEKQVEKKTEVKAAPKDEKQVESKPIPPAQDKQIQMIR